MLFKLFKRYTAKNFLIEILKNEKTSFRISDILKLFDILQQATPTEAQPQRENHRVVSERTPTIRTGAHVRPRDR